MGEIRVFGLYLNGPMFLLALTDVIVVGTVLFFAASEWGSGSSLGGALFALLGCSMVLLGKSAVGLYHSKFRATLSAISARMAVAFLMAAPTLIVGGMLIPLAPGKLMPAVLAGVAAYGALGLLQAGFFVLADAGALQRRILVLGAGEQAQALRSMRRRADRRGFQVAGFVAMEDEHPTVEPVVSPGDSLSRYASDNGVDEIVVAMKERRNRLPIDELVKCRFAGIEVTNIAEFMEREAGKIPLDLLRPGWMVFDVNPSTRLLEVTKRLFDMMASLFLLGIFVPVIVAAGIAIKKEDGWRAPLFYRQTRVGRDGRSFELVKFRSMRTDAEADGKAVWASRNDGRVTKVGRVLRKTRIDEIPQLFTVLRGSMSLVGPRPERPEFVAELEKCVPYYPDRHRIKPGVTGWAQLMYPYGASREDAREKLQYDLYYVKHRSVALDLLILLQTVEVVLFGKGAR